MPGSKSPNHNRSDTFDLLLDEQLQKVTESKNSETPQDNSQTDD